MMISSKKKLLEAFAEDPSVRLKIKGHCWSYRITLPFISFSAFWSFSSPGLSLQSLRLFLAFGLIVKICITNNQKRIEKKRKRVTANSNIEVKIHNFFWRLATKQHNVQGDKSGLDRD